MSNLSIKEIKNLTPYTNTKGFIISNSFQVKPSKYGVFSLGGGQFSDGFNNLNNVTDPIYNTIVGYACTLENIYITICQNNGNFITNVGVDEEFIIYKNGVSVYNTTLSSSTKTKFFLEDLQIDFLPEDLLCFSLNNLTYAGGVIITLHNFFRNANT